MIPTTHDRSSPRVPRTAREYATGIAELDRLLDLGPPPRSPDADRLELLSLLVEDYEARHDPIDDSDLTPQDVVEFMLEQRALTRIDLAEAMGGRNRVSDFFNGKRELSKGQIVALRALLGIPADLLM